MFAFILKTEYEYLKAARIPQPPTQADTGQEPLCSNLTRCLLYLLDPQGNWNGILIRLSVDVSLIAPVYCSVLPKVRTH